MASSSSEREVVVENEQRRKNFTNDSIIDSSNQQERGDHSGAQREERQSIDWEESCWLGFGQSGIGAMPGTCLVPRNVLWALASISGLFLPFSGQLLQLLLTPLKCLLILAQAMSLVQVVKADGNVIYINRGGEKDKRYVYDHVFTEGQEVLALPPPKCAAAAIILTMPSGFSSFQSSNSHRF